MTDSIHVKGMNSNIHCGTLAILQPGHNTAMRLLPIL